MSFMIVLIKIYLIARTQDEMFYCMWPTAQTHNDNTQVLVTSFNVRRAQWNSPALNTSVPSNTRLA